jgi:mRNA-degrading endonuclease RelE of RelBE toxin-antitoxin system
MAARPKGHRGQKHANQATPPTSTPYAVDMTDTASAVYSDLYQKAKDAEGRGDYSNTHITTFEMVRDAIKRIIPNDPLNKGYALRGDLSNIFRIRKGRLRICWIASSKMRRVCILTISESLRKAGDANDPYVILQNMVDAGTFDTAFAGLNVRMPRLRNQPRPSKQQ